MLLATYIAPQAQFPNDVLNTNKLPTSISEYSGYDDHVLEMPASHRRKYNGIQNNVWERGFGKVVVESMFAGRPKDRRKILGPFRFVAALGSLDRQHYSWEVLSSTEDWLGVLIVIEPKWQCVCV